MIPILLGWVIKKGYEGTGDSVPDLSYQIINGVPSQGSISDTSPPAHEIRWSNVCVGVKVVCNRNLVVFEGRSDETYAELGILRACSDGVGWDGGR